MYLYRVKTNLVVDIGNTRCKTAVYSGDTELESAAETFSEAFVEAMLKKYPGARCIYSSVATLTQQSISFLNHNGFVNVKECVNAPVKSIYQTPETLGDDRWAAVCGAAFLSGNQFPFMVIQAGTCITFDYVDELGCYTGGAISPGISLRLKALHNFTGRLPLVEAENVFNNMGLTTKDSILSGVMSGCLAEIKFRIDEFKKNHTESPVYIGGGDQHYFDFSHENHIFAVPKIVLVGLNHLLNLNP